MRVCFAINGDGLDAEAFAGPNDAAGDFTAVSNENLRQGGEEGGVE